RRLKHSTILDVNRRGKFILIELKKSDALTHGRATASPHAADQILVVHLRMTGKFLYLTTDNEIPKHAHAIFYLDNDRRLVFRDQRQFGVMKLVARSRLSRTKGVSELAPEPFSDDFSMTYLKEVLGRSRRTLKTFLLDQTKVLGLGNIYAAEALFRSGI